MVGLKIPGHEVRALVDKHDINKDGQLNMKEFKKVSILATDVIVMFCIGITQQALYGQWCSRIKFILDLKVVIT